MVQTTIAACHPAARPPHQVDWDPELVSCNGELPCSVGANTPMSATRTCRARRRDAATRRWVGRRAGEEEDGAGRAAVRLLSLGVMTRVRARDAVLVSMVLAVAGAHRAPRASRRVVFAGAAALLGRTPLVAAASAATPSRAASNDVDVESAAAPALVSTDDLEEVLIDLDPGGLVWTGLDVDDDLALLMALALNRTEQIKLVGVTVCGGNAPLKHTGPGLELLLRTAGATSAAFPMGVAYGIGWRDMHVAWPKLRRLDRLSPDVVSSDAAADLIIRAARASGPRGLTVLTLGPASNLARALTKDPAIAPLLRRVVLMGG